MFTQLLAGMVTTRGPRTVTGMLTGAGLSQTWAHHRVHRFFSRAAWDPRKIGPALTSAVIEALRPAGAPVRVAVDDTLLRRRGKKVWAALWTHDGSARSQDKIRPVQPTTSPHRGRRDGPARKATRWAP